jgi:hypothetical protein
MDASPVIEGDEPVAWHAFEIVTPGVAVAVGPASSPTLELGYAGAAGGAACVGRDGELCWCWWWWWV